MITDLISAAEHASDLLATAKNLVARDEPLIWGGILGVIEDRRAFETLGYDTMESFLAAEMPGSLDEARAQMAAYRASVAPRKP